MRNLYNQLNYSLQTKTFTMGKTFILLFVCYLNIIFAQNQNVGIGTAEPNESSILDISSSNKGVLVPRMTNLEIAAVFNPANGLMVFSTTDNHLYVFDSILVKWKQVQFSTTTIDLWQCGQDFAYNGKNYPTISLNGKCWMAENLNVGTMIQVSNNMTND